MKFSNFVSTVLMSEHFLFLGIIVSLLHLFLVPGVNNVLYITVKIKRKTVYFWTYAFYFCLYMNRLLYRWIHPF